MRKMMTVDDAMRITIKARKFTLVSAKTCYTYSIRKHPIITVILCFFILFYTTSPLMFSLFLSASPVLFLTALLLATLLSFGEPNYPQFQKEDDNITILHISPENTAIVQDSVDHVGLRTSEESLYGSSADNCVQLVDQGLQCADRILEEMEEEILGIRRLINDVEVVDNYYSLLLEEKDRYAVREEDDQDESPLHSTHGYYGDFSPSSSWKRVEDDEDKEDDDDDVDTSGLPRRSHNGSDDNSGTFHETEESGDDSDYDMDEHEEEDDEGEEDDSTSAISWTETDQMNLMELGTSEIERNKRLENLIARRNLRKSMVEKNLIDLDDADLPFNVPPISTTRQNPFDDSYDDTGLPPILGSAPSISQPGGNPFDLQYGSNEEKHVPDSEPMNSGSDDNIDEDKKLNQQVVSQEAEFNSNIDCTIVSLDTEQAEDVHVIQDDVEFTLRDIDDFVHLNESRIDLNVETVEEVCSSRSSLSSWSHVDETISGMNKGDTLSIESQEKQMDESHISAQALFVESDFRFTSEVADENQHMEPMYDSCSDTRAEVCEIGSLQDPDMSFVQESEIHNESLEMESSSQVVEVNDNQTLLMAVMELGDQDVGKEKLSEVLSGNENQNGREAPEAVNEHYLVDSISHDTESIEDHVSHDNVDTVNNNDVTPVVHHDLVENKDFQISNESASSGAQEQKPSQLIEHVSAEIEPSRLEQDQVQSPICDVMVDTGLIQSAGLEASISGPNHLDEPSEQCLNQPLEPSNTVTESGDEVSITSSVHVQDIISTSLSSELYATDQDGEIHEIDEGLLSDADSVEDFNVKEFEPVLLTKDSNMTENNLPVLEARSIEDIDLSCKQIREGVDAEEVNILPSMIEDELKNPAEYSDSDIRKEESSGIRSEHDDENVRVAPEAVNEANLVASSSQETESVEERGWVAPEAVNEDNLVDSSSQDTESVEGHVSHGHNYVDSNSFFLDTESRECNLPSEVDSVDTANHDDITPVVQEDLVEKLDSPISKDSVSSAPQEQEPPTLVEHVSEEIEPAEKLANEEVHELEEVETHSSSSSENESATDDMALTEESFEPVEKLAHEEVHELEEVETHSSSSSENESAIDDIALTEESFEPVEKLAHKEVHELEEVETHSSSSSDIESAIDDIALTEESFEPAEKLANEEVNELEEVETPSSSSYENESTIDDMALTEESFEPAEKLANEEVNKLEVVETHSSSSPDNESAIGDMALAEESSEPVEKLANEEVNELEKVETHSSSSSENESAIDGMALTEESFEPAEKLANEELRGLEEVETHSSSSSDDELAIDVMALAEESFEPAEKLVNEEVNELEEVDTHSSSSPDNESAIDDMALAEETSEPAEKLANEEVDELEKVETHSSSSPDNESAIKDIELKEERFEPEVKQVPSSHFDADFHDKELLIAEHVEECSSNKEVSSQREQGQVQSPSCDLKVYISGTGQLDEPSEQSFDKAQESSNILTESQDETNSTNIVHVHGTHDGHDRLPTKLSCVISDTTSIQSDSPEYVSPTSEDDMKGTIFDQIVYDDEFEDAEEFYNPAESFGFDDAESEDEIEQIDERVVSELDSVGDFNVNEIANDSLLTEQLPGEESSNTEIELMKDSNMTETNLELPVLEARSVEEVDLAFKQLNEEVDVVKVNVLPNVFEDESKNAVESNSDMEVVEASCLEDLTSALKEIADNNS
ncbi:hypothetical protein ACFE04_006475 [Oxalis oulophora]